MKNTIEIGNPVSGGASYTSRKKAFEHVSRGRAFICEEGKLWFIDRSERKARVLDPVKTAVPWNGSPRPPLLRTVKLNGVIKTMAPEYRPGEVRS